MVVYENGVTTLFKVEIHNETDDIYTLKNISIKLTDEENNEFILIGYIGESLEKEEAKYLQASIDQDLSSSLKLEYVVNK